MNGAKLDSSIENEQLQYKRHILLILSVLAIQLCLPYIVTYSFLQFEKYRFRNCLNCEFYNKGQYRPLSKENSPAERIYEFVVIHRHDGILEETYYTNEGGTVAVTYKNNAWKSTSNNLTWSGSLQMLFLSSGVLLLFVGLFHKMHRTQQDSSWRLMDYPDDRFERLSLIYGISIFIGNMVFFNISPPLRRLLF